MTQSAAAIECELAMAEPRHVAELGRILFDAFRGLHEMHGFPLEYPTEAIARQTIFILIYRKDFHGIAATLNGRLVGSGFVLQADEVGGIGPITVDPAFQGRGIAKSLTDAVVRHAESRGISKIRLMQEACNAQSLALYASLGFEAREEVAYLRARPAGRPDPSIRAATHDDLPAIADLSTRLYRVSRRNEVAAAIRYGSSPLLRERDGKIAGYMIAGINGHGVADTEDDALALVGEMARHTSCANANFFCPLSESSLLRGALKRGCKIIKVWTLMTKGPYDPPRRVWMPSSTY